MSLLSVQINDFLHYVGVNDRETGLFENMWPLDYGISYNSFLINSEKTALLDTVKITRVSDFTEKVREAIGDRPLDYLVIHHMEPDHSGSIPTILEIYPNVTIVGNKKTLEFLKDFYGEFENTLEVKDGDTLDLGTRKLKFFTTPMVHWPESMVSYEVNSKILFSQDAFGGYGSLDGSIFDDELSLESVTPEIRRYFTNIVGKFSKQVQLALKKLSSLEISMICPVHGPIWRTNPEKIIELYDKWSRYEVEDGVVIVYGSMYGNTQKMAEIIARELVVQGIEKVKVFDLSKTHESYILSSVWKYKGLMLGSCTYNNYMFPLMTKFTSILEMNKIENHILGIFGSYSWSGAAVKSLKAFAEKTKFEVLDESVEVKCSVKDKDAEALKALAREMAEKIKNNK